MRALSNDIRLTAMTCLHSAVCGLLLLVGWGCSGRPCSGGCPTAGIASFDLACGPADLVRVALSGPCSNEDTNPSSYLLGPTGRFLVVSSRSAGVCHVTLTFGTGFVYSADVTFTSQADADGCCLPYIGPTQTDFSVDNPHNTCVDAGR